MLCLSQARHFDVAAGDGTISVTPSLSSVIVGWED